MTQRKTPAAAVQEFRQRHGLTQPQLDQLLGFSSKGLAIGRWERQGAPYYASLLFKLIDEYGKEPLEEMIAAGTYSADRLAVLAFRARHNLTSMQMDTMFGLSSKGRAARRWIDPAERGAPNYIVAMMRYCDMYGCGFLKGLAAAK